MKINSTTILALVAVVVTGCASTVTVNITPSIDGTLCRPDMAAEVWWGTQWRADQKDVSLRDAAAEQGIQAFLARPGCFASTVLHRGAPPSGGASQGVARIVLVVRELGPTLRIGSTLALVEGATGVVFDVETVGQGQLAPRTTVHWRDGGPGTVKGVVSLPVDMAAALATVFRAPPLR